MTAATSLDRRAMFGWLRELKEIAAEKYELTLWHQAFMADMAQRSVRLAEREAEINAGIEQLAAELRIPGSQHVDVPGMARIQFTTREATVRVADDKAFIAWARDAERFDLIRVKTTESVDAEKAKALAADTLRHSGEILPGIEEVPERTSMSIKFQEPRNDHE